MIKTTNKTNKTKTNKTLIEKFIADNIHEAVQGSEQWKQDRGVVIGGSEISTVIGKNRFSNLADLVAQKVGFNNFTGNNATRWGNLFEGASEIYFKTLFGVEIFSTGSIKHKNIENHRYSPDGICALDICGENKVVLLEFKSPFGTVPTKSIPPHYLPQVKAGLCTIDITEIGLFINNMFRKCSKNDLDFTLNYDNVYHKDTEAKLKNINKIIANGMILFSIPESKVQLIKDEIHKLKSLKNESHKQTDFNMADIASDSESDTESNETDSNSNFDESNHYDDGTNILYQVYEVIKAYESQKEITQEKMIDFGAKSADMFNQFLELYKPEDTECLFETTYTKPHFNKDLFSSNKIKRFKSSADSNIILPDEFSHFYSNEYIDKICKEYNFDKIISKFAARCVKRNEIPCGFLSWKLLRSSIISVDKEENYLDNIKDKIDDIINIVKEINKFELYDDKIKKFEEFFPNDQIVREYYEKKLSKETLDMLIDMAENSSDSDND